MALVALIAAAGMTTMVANASRVAAVAEDATRLLGLRSPGHRATDVIATKRRQTQFAARDVSPLAGGGATPPASAGGYGYFASGPFASLLDQPGFVGPGLVAVPGNASDVAVADLPVPAFAPGGPIVLGGGNGGNGGGGGMTSSGGPVAPTVPAVPEPSTWLMMIGGFAAIGTALRRAARRAALRGG